MESLLFVGKEFGFSFAPNSTSVNGFFYIFDFYILIFCSRGCASKAKLMGGWQKQKTDTETAAYAYLSVSPDLLLILRL